MLNLFTNKRGMTMLEVLISIALLSLVSVPLIMSFMNSLMMSKLSKNQIEVNAVTRVVKEVVTSGFANNLPLNNYDIDGDGNLVEHHLDVNGDGIVGDLYLDLLRVTPSSEPATSGGLLIRTTPEMYIPGYEDYVFTIHYDAKNYHDSNYDTRNVLLTIYDKEKNKVVNKLKIAVDI